MGARGKVIKYTSSSFERNIRLMDSVELFSERLWAKGEQDEPFNCAFSAVLSSATGLLLAANSEQVDVTDLLEFVLLYEFFMRNLGTFIYTESHRFTVRRMGWGTILQMNVIQCSGLVGVKLVSGRRQRECLLIIYI